MRSLATLCFAALAVLMCLTALSSCAQNDSEDISTDPVPGLARPVRLALDSTWVELADFLPESLVQQAEVRWLPELGSGDLKLSVAGGGVWIPGEPTGGIGALALTVQAADADFPETVHIPVFAPTAAHHIFQYRAPEASENHITVGISGGFNGWSATASPMTKIAEGLWEIGLTLPRGTHPYQIVLDGKMGPDPTNDKRVDNGFGSFNCLMHVGGVQGKFELSAIGFGGNQVHDVHLQGPCGAQIWAWWEDYLFAMPRLDAQGQGSVRIPAAAYGAGRTHLRIWAEAPGIRSDALLIPLEGGLPVTDAVKLTRADWHAQTMYFLLVDRFLDGDKANNAPVPDDDIALRANNLGGDLQGISQAIANGYFEELGMGTIWISPITTNPSGAWGLWQDSTTSVRSKFSGYHGYWPISNKEIDPRLGTRSAFDAAVDAAHDADMNFLLDYVANHVHEQHPIYVDHPDWATDLYLPDGSLNTERWDDHRLTTWFDTFLPTLDLEQPEVAAAMSDSATWWVLNSEIDGFRHDATKHIPETFWRMLTQKIKRSSNRPIFQIGETYGSPELIDSYIGSGLLDAQFDFNHYDAAVAAFSDPETGVEHLIRTAEAGLRTYGSHHLMGMITGNQDRPRFTSLAEGTVQSGEDTKLAGWTRDIQHDGPNGFASMKMLTAYLMCMPGIPCVYYGDELAYVGGNDPDNRRMMRFENWSDDEQNMHDWTAHWAKLRRSRMELMYGQTRLRSPAPSVIEIRRDYLGSSTTVTIDTRARTVDTQLIN